MAEAQSERCVLCRSIAACVATIHPHPHPHLHPLFLPGKIDRDTLIKGARSYLLVDKKLSAKAVGEIFDAVKPRSSSNITCSRLEEALKRMAAIKQVTLIELVEAAYHLASQQVRLQTHITK
jgi:hypothetical protein